MSNYIVNNSDLTLIAEAIRAKSGGSSQLAFPSGFLDEIASISTGGGGNWTLIGTKVFENVAEYTNTSTSETMETGIDIKNGDYAWILTIITCDSIITTSNEWGMTIAIGGRYTTNSSYYNGTSIMQKGTATLSRAAMVTNTLGSGSYGVGVPNNTTGINISRKCHSTGCPKIRAGNYTVKVYAMTSL